MIHRSIEVEKATDNGNSVDLEVLTLPDGKASDGHDEASRRTVTSKFVVGCDGANSKIRRDSGVSYHVHSASSRPWLILDVVPKSSAVNPKWKDWDVGRQYCDWARPRTAVPTPWYRRRWEWMLLDGESEAEAMTPIFQWSLLKEFGVTSENAVIERGAVYHFKGAWCESFNCGRILLAGDAAHLTPPFGAQGLNSGLRDAKALVWRLDLAIREPTCDWQKLFDDYTSEQLSIAKRFIKTACGIESMVSITDPEIARKRDAMMAHPPPGGPPSIEYCLSSPGMYQHDSSFKHSTCYEPGCTFIQDQVESSSRKGPFDQIMGQGWTLIGDESGDPAQELDQKTASAFKNLLHGKSTYIGTGEGSSFKDSTGRYTSIMKKESLRAVLTRPDYYVYGWARSREDVNTLVKSAVDHLGIDQVQNAVKEIE